MSRSNALTLAANEDPRHMLRCIASFRQRGVRSVPARMISVVTSGPAFAVVALPASGSMDNGLVRPRVSVLVDIKFDGIARGYRRRRRLHDETGIRGDPL